MYKYLLHIILIITLIACGKGGGIGPDVTPYIEHFPSYFPSMPVSSDNPTTVEGVELGRMLYYDKLLHPNHTLSCSFCHNQSNSFSTASSNSLAHINIGWNTSFLWNGKVEGSLEEIMLFEVEEFFGTNLSDFNNHEKYPALFKKAFGVEEITSKELSYALAQFFRTLNSYDSKYDRVLQGLATLTPEEADGYDIFFSERGDCFHCHASAMWTDNLFHNNGLDANPHPGRSAVTGSPLDVGRFKTPTLRNIEFTAPYMHDGRYQTLEEVIDFYSHGLQWSPTIDPLMKNVNISGGVDLSAQDKINLIAFLKTLSDTSYLSRPSLSDPF